MADALPPSDRARCEIDPIKVVIPVHRVEHGERTARGDGDVAKMRPKPRSAGIQRPGPGLPLERAGAGSGRRSSTVAAVRVVGWSGAITRIGNCAASPLNSSVASSARSFSGALSGVMNVPVSQPRPSRRSARSGCGRDDREAAPVPARSRGPLLVRTAA